MSPQQPGPKPRNAYRRMKHIQNLEKFAQDLSAIVNTLLPSYDKPYGQVSVLAFHWENDDIGVAPLEVELLDALRKIYGFNVESFTIPATSAAPSDLVAKLINFCEKWDAEDALAIYIYSGHAEADLSWYQYLLGGRIIGPKVNWFQMRIGPETADGDVLYIFDTCFAASAAIYDGPEVLASLKSSTENAALKYSGG